jgi:hypothetical protein
MKIWHLYVPNFKVQSQHLSWEDWPNSTNMFGQDSLSIGQDSNSELQEHKIEVSTTTFNEQWVCLGRHHTKMHQYLHLDRSYTCLRLSLYQEVQCRCAAPWAWHCQQERECVVHTCPQILQHSHLVQSHCWLMYIFKPHIHTPISSCWRNLHPFCILLNKVNI